MDIRRQVGRNVQRIRKAAGLSQEDLAFECGLHRTYISGVERGIRKPGTALHPARESREVLDGIKREIGSLAFSAQYQQRPIPMEGNLVKAD